MKLRTLFIILGALILPAAVLHTARRIAAQDLAHHLRGEAVEARARVRNWAGQAFGASAVLAAVVQQVKPSLDSPAPHQAEALLNRALRILDGDDAHAGNSSPLPVYTGAEQPSNLYVKPEPVSIEGYDGNAMEPFISPDGRHLFFNNENDPRANTNLHFAERTGVLSFRYLGELPGVNSEALDAVPSLDCAGRFFFTSLRDYGRTMNSLYTGEFDGKHVANVRPVPGDISPKALGTVNMDAGISPDGQTLYISRAVIFPGAPAPKKCDLVVARLNNAVFSIDPDGERIMKNVNTVALEYAPAISASGRELYFTRASQPQPGPDASSARLRIMVATRTSERAAFAEPRVLTALAGFVEAPTVSLDGTEMFFHQKIGRKFVICRATRNSTH